MTTTNPLGVPAHRHTNPDGTKGGWVANTATAHPTATIGPDARVHGNARVYDNARVYGTARVSGNARVYEPQHVLTVGPIGSQDQHATLMPTPDGPWVVVGCWQGPLTKLLTEAERRAPNHMDDYTALHALFTSRAARWNR